MAARGLLTPFHCQFKITAAPLVPTCISYLRKTLLRRRRCHARFYCSHRQPLETDMSTYRLQFAQKMAMAGLNPNHRLAIAVSGGPDSIALCVLTIGWKSGNSDTASHGRSKPIDGLLAIVVDHGLRTESAEEADIVRNRVLDMGIKCEVASCEWLDGKPKLGHLQEDARDKRYEALQKICIEQQISILLIAHHADDQAELFIFRLSRNSGVIGLAGMALTSQRFSMFPVFNGKEIQSHSILLVRPLLEFSKEDMYNICRDGNQQWVEDPTNRSPLYARNRIRMSLNSMSSLFKAELQATISACRRTRLHVENHCHLLLNRVVSLVPQHGYAVIDLETLRSMDTKDIYVAKFITLLVQFISQRHRPLRGKGFKLLLNYLRTFQCKTSLTVAGCYLSPAPGSKGTKVLVCCSTDSSLHLLLNSRSQNCFASSELEEIALKVEKITGKIMSDASSVPFLDATSPEAVLVEAKRQGIISDSSHETIISLQKQASESFKHGAEVTSDSASKHIVSSPGATPSIIFRSGQVGYFMNRFLLEWKVSNDVANNASSGQCFCNCCVFGNEMVAEVRCMEKVDWMYIHDLAKTSETGDNVAVEMEHRMGEASDYAKLSAARASESLKSIPAAGRRALPVLVNGEGVLLSIPSIGFSQCPHLKVSAVFHPRIPLGGGHSSFL